MRPPPVTQESIRSHPDPNHPSNHFFCSSFHPALVCRILLRPPLVHVLFRAVAADIQVLRTIFRNNALPFLFAWEQTHTVGF
jgi:hypothetical protein